jgi:SAM-dependent methyltransferase
VPESIRRNYIYPLALLAKDAEWDRPIRLFLDGGGIADSEYRLLGGSAAFPRFGRERRDWLEKMGGWLEDFGFPSLRTPWGRYETGVQFAPGYTAILDPRSAVVDRLMRQQRPRRVIDLGCNAGFFTALASRGSPGCEVYAVDSDQEAVEHLYRDARASTDQASITVALDDVLTLSEDPLRIHGDLALALALSHHLYFSQECQFPVIAKLLASFTTDSLLTEFMPNGLGGTVPKPDPLPADYTLEMFVRSFETHFRDVEVIRWQIPAGHCPRIFIHARGKMVPET